MITTSVRPYGRGSNGCSVTIGRLTIWYSYRTPIAFELGSQVRAVRQNDWGPTTGRHLNAIDGGSKATRLPGDEFQRQLSDAIRAVGAEVD